MSTTSLLVLAAGMGSRYGGVKQVDPVGAAGETILEYSVYDALASGFDEVVFLIRRGIEADFRERVLARLPRSVGALLAFQELDSLLGPGDLAAAREAGRTKPWGTGHALLCAAEAIRSPFAVINADDFYGRASFRVVHDFLAARGPESREWCMAGYELRNTTSPHGSVSRGLCSVDAAGRLASVVEHVAVSEKGGRFSSRLADGSELELRGSEVVSMNFWGLAPAVFDLALPLFRAFLEQGRSSPKAEFYLPALVDALVARGEASVSVLPTPEAWFGLTYREDAGAARERVAALTAAGAYPSPLWSAGAPR
jgi:hypothetical protein